MKQQHNLRTRAMAFLLALVCILGLFPSEVFAASDTIKLESVGFSGVAYRSPKLGSCQLHEMGFRNGNGQTTGFCATKGGGMGGDLVGQTWGNKREVTDPTVKKMMAYFYCHSTGTFTEQAHALGVDDVWQGAYAWYMNAWVQAIIWRYKQGSLTNPVNDCAEELMYVFNSIDGTHYSDISEVRDGTSFHDRAEYILQLADQGVWGECKAYEYGFTGSGTNRHPASGVQKIILGDLTINTTTVPEYELIIKKVDSTNPSKALAGAGFHIENENGSYRKDVVTGADGTCKVTGLKAGTYGITETSAPEGYEIDNAGPVYVTLPNGDKITVTVTFKDTPTITSEGRIRKVDADNPSKGLAGAVIKIEGVDNNFTGTFVTGEDGWLMDVPWDTMPTGSYVAEVRP